MKGVLKIGIIKKSFPLLLLSAIFLFFNGCSAPYYQESGSGYQAEQGYNLADLNEYGDWINLPPYGRVWRPSVVNGWLPFHNGRWIYSDNDWAWDSYEPFGWIVYHYGYWYYDPIYGWVWIPRNNGWMPATVQWRQFGDYIAWSPLLPPGVNYGEPWNDHDGRYWHSVRMENFTKDNVGKLRDTHPQWKERDNSGKQIIVGRTRPTQNEIENKTGVKIRNTQITKEPVQTPISTFRRMTLPDNERVRNSSYEQRVKRDVIIPRSERNTTDRRKK